MSQNKPSVILRLTKLRMIGTHPLEYQRLHIEIWDQFEDHVSMDGSKDQNQGDAVAVCQRNKFGVCHPDQSSIFTAEARALFLALECIDVSNCTKYVVYSDLFSCLQAIVGLKMNQAGQTGPLPLAVLATLGLHMLSCSGGALPPPDSLLDCGPPSTILFCRQYA